MEVISAHAKGSMLMAGDILGSRIARRGDVRPPLSIGGSLASAIAGGAVIVLAAAARPRKSAAP